MLLQGRQQRTLLATGLAFPPVTRRCQRELVAERLATLLEAALSSTIGSNKSRFNGSCTSRQSVADTAKNLLIDATAVSAAATTLLGTKHPPTHSLVVHQPPLATTELLIHQDTEEPSSCTPVSSKVAKRLWWERGHFKTRYPLPLERLNDCLLVWLDLSTLIAPTAEPALVPNEDSDGGKVNVHGISSLLCDVAYIIVPEMIVSEISTMTFGADESLIFRSLPYSLALFSSWLPRACAFCTIPGKIVTQEELETDPAASPHRKKSFLLVSIIDLLAKNLEEQVLLWRAALQRQCTPLRAEKSATGACPSGNGKVDDSVASVRRETIWLMTLYIAQTVEALRCYTSPHWSSQWGSSQCANSALHHLRSTCDLLLSVNCELRQQVMRIANEYAAITVATWCENAMEAKIAISRPTMHLVSVLEVLFGRSIEKQVGNMMRAETLMMWLSNLLYEIITKLSPDTSCPKAGAMGVVLLQLMVEHMPPENLYNLDNNTLLCCWLIKVCDCSLHAMFDNSRPSVDRHEVSLPPQEMFATLPSMALASLAIVERLVDRMAAAAPDERSGRGIITAVMSHMVSAIDNPRLHGFVKFFATDVLGMERVVAIRPRPFPINTNHTAGVVMQCRIAAFVFHCLAALIRQAGKKHELGSFLGLMLQRLMQDVNAVADNGFYRTAPANVELVVQLLLSAAPLMAAPHGGIWLPHTSRFLQAITSLLEDLSTRNLHKDFSLILLYRLLWTLKVFIQAILQNLATTPLSTDSNGALILSEVRCCLVQLTLAHAAVYPDISGNVDNNHSHNDQSYNSHSNSFERVADMTDTWLGLLRPLLTDCANASLLFAVSSKRTADHVERNSDTDHEVREKDRTLALVLTWMWAECSKSDISPRGSLSCRQPAPERTDGLLSVPLHWMPLSSSSSNPRQHTSTVSYSKNSFPPRSTPIRRLPLEVGTKTALRLNRFMAADVLPLLMASIASTGIVSASIASSSAALAPADEWKISVQNARKVLACHVWRQGTEAYANLIVLSHKLGMDASLIKSLSVEELWMWNAMLLSSGAYLRCLRRRPGLQLREMELLYDCVPVQSIIQRCPQQLAVSFCRIIVGCVVMNAPFQRSPELENESFVTPYAERHFLKVAIQNLTPNMDGSKQLLLLLFCHSIINALPPSVLESVAECILVILMDKLVAFSQPNKSISKFSGCSSQEKGFSFPFMTYDGILSYLIAFITFKLRGSHTEHFRSSLVRCTYLLHLRSQAGVSHRVTETDHLSSSFSVALMQLLQERAVEDVVTLGEEVYPCFAVAPHNSDPVTQHPMCILVQWVELRLAETFTYWQSVDQHSADQHSATRVGPMGGSSSSKLRLLITRASRSSRPLTTHEGSSPTITALGARMGSTLSLKNVSRFLADGLSHKEFEEVRSLRVLLTSAKLYPSIFGLAEVVGGVLRGAFTDKTASKEESSGSRDAAEGILDHFTILYNYYQQELKTINTSKVPLTFNFRNSYATGDPVNPSVVAFISVIKGHDIHSATELEGRPIYCLVAIVLALLFLVNEVSGGPQTTQPHLMYWRPQDHDDDATYSTKTRALSKLNESLQRAVKRITSVVIGFSGLTWLLLRLEANLLRSTSLSLNTCHTTTGDTLLGKALLGLAFYIREASLTVALAPAFEGLRLASKLEIWVERAHAMTTTAEECNRTSSSLASESLRTALQVRLVYYTAFCATTDHHFSARQLPPERRAWVSAEPLPEKHNSTDYPFRSWLGPYFSNHFSWILSAVYSSFAPAAEPTPTNEWASFVTLVEGIEAEGRFPRSPSSTQRNHRAAAITAICATAALTFSGYGLLAVRTHPTVDGYRRRYALPTGALDTSRLLEAKKSFVWWAVAAALRLNCADEGVAAWQGAATEEIDDDAVAAFVQWLNRNGQSVQLALQAADCFLAPAESTIQLSTPGLTVEDKICYYFGSSCSPGDTTSTMQRNVALRGQAESLRRQQPSEAAAGVSPTLFARVVSSITPNMQYARAVSTRLTTRLKEDTQRNSTIEIRLGGNSAKSSLVAGWKSTPTTRNLEGPSWRSSLFAIALSVITNDLSYPARSPRVVENSDPFEQKVGQVRRVLALRELSRGIDSVKRLTRRAILHQKKRLTSTRNIEAFCVKRCAAYGQLTILEQLLRKELEVCIVWWRLPPEWCQLHTLMQPDIFLTMLRLPRNPVALYMGAVSCNYLWQQPRKHRFFPAPLDRAHYFTKTSTSVLDPQLSTHSLPAEDISAELAENNRRVGVSAVSKSIREASRFKNRLLRLCGRTRVKRPARDALDTKVPTVTTTNGKKNRRFRLTPLTRTSGRKWEYVSRDAYYCSPGLLLRFLKEHSTKHSLRKAASYTLFQNSDITVCHALACPSLSAELLHELLLDRFAEPYSFSPPKKRQQVATVVCCRPQALRASGGRPSGSPKKKHAATPFPYHLLSPPPINTLIRSLCSEFQNDTLLKLLMLRRLEFFAAAELQLYSLQLLHGIREDKALQLDAVLSNAGIAFPSLKAMNFFLTAAETSPMTRQEGRKIAEPVPNLLPMRAFRLLCQMSFPPETLNTRTDSRATQMSPSVHFYAQLMDISQELIPFSQAERQQRLTELLSAIAAPAIGRNRPRLPFADSLEIVQADVHMAKVMQSAAKAPYRLSFTVQTCTGADQALSERLLRCAMRPLDGRRKPGPNEGEAKVASAAAEERASSGLDSDNEHDDGDDNSNTPNDEIPERRAIIFKMADDIRQDQLALQLMALLQRAFENAGLPLWLRSYGVIPNRALEHFDASGQAPKSGGLLGGMIEVVDGAMSRHQLGKESGLSLDQWFHSKYNHPALYAAAQWEFSRSLAAYSVASFLLQMKDRHNGNLLITREGRIVHIDFGFLFDYSPGRDLRVERAPFKLTLEMINILGGSSSTDAFQAFEAMVIQGYLSARQHATLFLDIVNMMAPSGLPCFKRKSLRNLRKRFQLDRSDLDAANFMHKQVVAAFNAFSTRLYDVVQYMQQGIAH